MALLNKQQKVVSILHGAPAQSSLAPRPPHYFPLRRHSVLDLQRLLLRFPNAYGFVQDLLTPTLTVQRWRHEVPTPRDHVVLNLGCGATVLDPELINVDIVHFPHVDIQADFSLPLPIRSGSVDAVLSIAVLEHLAEPAFMAAEIARILKPGGTVFVATPFHYPFHDAPDDFTRWTVPGMKRLLGEPFEIVASGPRGGAMGVVILALAHVGGQLLSFGSERLYAIVNFALMAALAPLKILDLLLVRLPFSTHLCPNIYVTARRKAESGSAQGTS